MKEVTIILPVSNSMPHLDVMIKSLYNSTSFPFDLMIIESESTDGTFEYVNKLEDEKDNVKVFHTKKSGLVNAINFGIKKCKNDVYLTQDDVIHFKLYGRDWLFDMWKASQDKRVGIVTCLNGGGISGEDYIKGFRWVGTWSAYIPRRTIDRVGLFDNKMGPGDDIDYCYRIKSAYLLCGIIDYWVQHHRLTEHGDADDKLKQLKMAKYFKKKHGI